MQHVVFCQILRDESMKQSHGKFEARPVSMDGGPDVGVAIHRTGNGLHFPQADVFSSQLKFRIVRIFPRSSCVLDDDGINRNDCRAH